ncbi:MAG: hypothetical protein KAR40_15555 [Candidatus Sabulitectum sp.]|nr:hypothetical protein [Candidatus Sabulitectum sp.]
MMITEEQIGGFLKKWQDILRLRDWDIKPVLVTRNWRKSGDVKIDRDNHMAAVMIHDSTDPAHLEEVVVHELLHLKLYGMDQLLEETINILFGSDDSDPKKEFAMNTFFLELESTVEDLTKAMLTAHGRQTDFWFKRVDRQIEEELRSREVASE